MSYESEVKEGWHIFYGSLTLNSFGQNDRLKQFDMHVTNQITELKEFRNTKPETLNTMTPYCTEM